MARRTPVELRVAARVKALREKQGLSQQRLAALARTSRSQVTLIEQGERAPTITTLEAFARALSVPLVDLVAEEDYSTAPKGSPDRADRLAATVRGRGPAFLRAVERVVHAMSRLADEKSVRSTRRRSPR